MYAAIVQPKIIIIIIIKNVLTKVTLSQKNLQRHFTIRY